MATRVYSQFVVGDLPVSWPVQFMALDASGNPVTGAGSWTIRRTLPGEGAGTDITATTGQPFEEDATNFAGLYTLPLDGQTVGGQGPVAIKFEHAGVDPVVIILTKIPREAVLVS